VRIPAVHAVTDDLVASLPDLAVRARSLAAAGTALHARGPGLTGRAHWQLARLFASVSPAAVFINDHIETALALPHAGVVLPERGLPVDTARRILGPGRLLGVSIHDERAAERAAADGAAFVLFGPVFPTTSHPGARPQGLDVLATIVRVGVPVIAIGGITIERARLARDAGAAGVAAIRALWRADDPNAAASAMQGTFHERDGQRSATKAWR
jgi:thiamine-phosphate pyrophosphorylase